MSKEKALMLFDWYDKPISGVAEMAGQQVVFERIYSEESEDYTDSFYLTVLTDDEFATLVPLWDKYVCDGSKFSFYDVIGGASFRSMRVRGTFSGRRPDLEVISEELFVEWGEAEAMSDFEVWSNAALLVLKKFLKCEWYDLAEVRPSGFMFRIGEHVEVKNRLADFVRCVESFEGELKWKCYKTFGSSLEIYEVQILEKYEQAKKSYEDGKLVTFGAMYGERAKELGEKSSRDIGKLVKHLVLSRF